MRAWQPSDVEHVSCFRCGTAGQPLYDRPPFGVVKCPDCCQVFVSPRLTDEARHELYDDPRYFEGKVYTDVDARFDLATKLQGIWSEGRLDLIEKAAGGARGKRLLEVGCAYGLFLTRADLRGFDVVGFEYSVTAAKRVREALGYEVHDGELETSALDGESFDVVCFWDVIEHVPDPREYLQAVVRVAKPGAVVALSCPYVSSLPARALRARWWTLKPWEHVWHFTPETLTRLFDDVGLRTLAVVKDPTHRANLTRVDSLVALARVPVQQHAMAGAAVAARSLAQHADEPFSPADDGESASTV